MLRAACHGSDLKREGWPSVSVVVPVRNEARHLERAVASILDQHYPEPFDVCLAVAPSDDDTAEVAARIASTNDRVRVVDNPAGVTPAGLNAAIRATFGSIVVRVDGHAELSPGYIRRAVETMCQTGAVNVGGLQVPHPETPFEEAVAAATTSWMGTGGATYRMGGSAGSVDTVYLGVFDRAAAETVGWFDETLIRNQDYELNIRLRAAGGTVWFDPELRVGYRPRGTWSALARQYFEYGWWKAVVARLHPESIRARQAGAALAAPGFAIGIAALWRRNWGRTACVTAAAGAALAPNALRRVAGPVVVIVVMQVCWSSGFLLSGALRACRIPSGRATADPPLASCG